MDPDSNLANPHVGKTVQAQGPISSLGLEILECIFEYVLDTSPLTISSLTLVSKLFYNSARGFRSRDRLFEYKNDNRIRQNVVETTQKSVRELIANPENSYILKSIRYLRIESDSGWKASYDEDDEVSKSQEDEVETKWRPMSKLIEMIANLKEVSFRGHHPMPVVLLHALEKHHPKARLHVKDWTRRANDTDHNDAAELALARSLNLRSIEATLWNSPGFDLRMPALKRIIALSPHLESVDVSEGQAGCIVYEYSPEELQEQSRRGRLFDVDNPSPNSIKSLRSSGLDSVFRLQDVTDISKLESLDIGHFLDLDFFSKDGAPNTRFPSLKHLSIRSFWCYDKNETKLLIDAVESFLVSCNPLTSISLTGHGGGLEVSSFLAPHGLSLRTLELHEIESSSSKTKRMMLPIEQIQRINQLLPLLEDINVDINRSEDGSTEREIISALACFPNLKIIRFHIDIGLAIERSRPSTLFANSDMPTFEEPSYQENPFHVEDDHWIENIWALFREQKSMNGSVPLTELHVKVGEWERKMGGGYPGPWVTWEESNRSYTIATRTDRDDRPNEIFVRRRVPYTWGREECTRKLIPETIRPSKLGKRKSANEDIADLCRARFRRVY